MAGAFDGSGILVARQARVQIIQSGFKQKFTFLFYNCNRDSNALTRWFVHRVGLYSRLNFMYLLSYIPTDEF
jgi:hypothetical protein